MIKQFDNLDAALEDNEFCAYINSLDLGHCYNCLNSGKSRYDLYKLLEEEGINPFSSMSDILYEMFKNSDIVKVNIPRNVVSIGFRAFEDCGLLTDVTIDDGTEAIYDFAFNRCGALKGVTIGRNVEIISNCAFFHCTSLTSINIPNTVKKIKDYAFSECFRLKSVTIGNSVTTIGAGAFSDCINLTRVVVPDSVAFIDRRAFENCYNLTSVIIPSSLKNISNFVFSGCRNLRELTYEGTKDDWQNLSKSDVWNVGSRINNIICKDGELHV